MAQLCLWTKIRTKQWLVLGVSAFQCVRAPNVTIFLVYISAKIKITFIWKDDFFFLPKSASVSRSYAIFPSVVQAYTQPYSLGGRIKLIICQIRHELGITTHEISTSRKKTLDGGPNIYELYLILIWSGKLEWCEKLDRNRDRKVVMINYVFMYRLWSTTRGVFQYWRSLPLVILFPSLKTYKIFYRRGITELLTNWLQVIERNVLQNVQKNDSFLLQSMLYNWDFFYGFGFDISRLTKYVRLILDFFFLHFFFFFFVHLPLIRYN